SHLPADVREQQAARLAQEENLRRFDLARGPLARLLLLKVAEGNHVLICTMHHIVGDGQSFEVIIAEMSRLYTSSKLGEPSPLAEPSVQYADYAAWQRQWLQGEVLETRLAYWRRQLKDAPQRLSLPQQKARPRVQTFRGARRDIRLTADKTEALRELSRGEGVTLLMTMLSGFTLLLNQYTGDEDIVVGSVSANRERAEAERLIGILATPLVLRVDLSGAETFRDVMRRVRDVCLDAYTFQLPPELMKVGLKSERLFDVWFQLERREREQLEMEGLRCERYTEGHGDTRFELSMVLTETDDEVVGHLEYDDRIFKAQTIERMLGEYWELLGRMVDDPAQRL
ncbi:MAG: condensation domain-containing protein, partial [Pyrinomonadaceae bacterium]